MVKRIRTFLNGTMSVIGDTSEFSVASSRTAAVITIADMTRHILKKHKSIYQFSDLEILGTNIIILRVRIDYSTSVALRNY